MTDQTDTPAQGYDAAVTLTLNMVVRTNDGPDAAARLAREFIARFLASQTECEGLAYDVPAVTEYTLNDVGEGLDVDPFDDDDDGEAAPPPVSIADPADLLMIRDALECISPGAEEDAERAERLAVVFAAAVEGRDIPAAPPAPAPIRIVLNLSGGVLQGASIDHGAIDLITVDYETGYGEDPETVMDVPQSPIGGADNTTTAEGSVVALGAYEVDAPFVQAVFAAHEAREGAN